ncbi:hydantoinase B/oxoprolinase family protein [Candidatus Riflebacteria bacterium]
MRFLENTSKKWIFAVDRGGTFTDVIGIDCHGTVHYCKLLSTSTNYNNSIYQGIKNLLGEEPGNKNIAVIRLGSTLTTNALLERKGSKVALLITEGFDDLLEIGDQSRNELFSINICKPEQLYNRVITVKERINAEGEVEIPLDLERLESDLSRLKKASIQVLAIVLMNSWKNPVHEKEIFHLARSMNFSQISASHRVMRVIKIVDRGRSTLVDAYLNPLLHEYKKELAKCFPDISLEFIKSNGGLAHAGDFLARDSILSGPAGGVLACAALSKMAEVIPCIGFDMGGTSTDVSRFDGLISRINEATTAGITFKSDRIEVESVAAGGGSLLWFDGQRLRVGPHSAGANPGPACYGLGGPLTITDANLISGRIIRDIFPSKNNGTGLSLSHSMQKFRTLCRKINKELGKNYTPHLLADDFIRIANEHMARAIKKISVARGYDLRKHTLICYGGAAPQHACSLASLLNIKQILIHPLASMLSAYGILLASRSFREIISIMSLFSKKSYLKLQSQLDKIRKKFQNKFKSTGAGFRKNKFSEEVQIELRFSGSDGFILLPVFSENSWQPFKKIIQMFKSSYLQYYGFIPEEKEIDLGNFYYQITYKGLSFNEVDKTHTTPAVTQNDRTENKQCFLKGEWHSLKQYKGDHLSEVTSVSGPCLISFPFTTVFVEDSFVAKINKFGHILIENKGHKQKIVHSEKKDPMLLEIFSNTFMSVAEQMGNTLKNTAHSVNIKERNDFSCAIFDNDANLVANAPHIPVHLGAIGETVNHIATQNKGNIKPGDIFLSNNPFKGGSHLPDITLVSPFFSSCKRLIFFIANRGHHADIGGTTPGSMPPFSTSLSEEGIIFDNFLLLRDGKLRKKELIEKLNEAPFPARNLPERMSDILAQIAANQKGIDELNNLIAHYPLKMIKNYMKYIQDNAAFTVARALSSLLGKSREFETSFTDHLDDGSRISARIKIFRQNVNLTPRIEIDFSGTSAQVKGNLNAPIAVTKAAVLYVLRCLAGEDIPLNSGCFLNVDLNVPYGSILNPKKDCAVVSGNVETSQRVVDVLFGALGICAASQGTMNNFLFGRDRGECKPYYETIGGGSGAGLDFNGASGVQVHMTNTRITDPEILENRFPYIRLLRFCLRRNSGGRGKNNGGDGVERAFLFKEQMHFSILSQRREYFPYGLKGGENGKKGKNYLIHSDGKVKPLPGNVEGIVLPGETILIKTPGGGGYGDAKVS